MSISDPVMPCATSCIIYERDARPLTVSPNASTPPGIIAIACRLFGLYAPRAPSVIVGSALSISLKDLNSFGAILYALASLNVAPKSFRPFSYSEPFLPISNKDCTTGICALISASDTGWDLSLFFGAAFLCPPKNCPRMPCLVAPGSFVGLTLGFDPSLRVPSFGLKAAVSVGTTPRSLSSFLAPLEFVPSLVFKPCDPQVLFSKNHKTACISPGVRLYLSASSPVIRKIDSLSVSFAGWAATPSLLIGVSSNLPVQRLNVRVYHRSMVVSPASRSIPCNPSEYLPSFLPKAKNPYSLGPAFSFAVT